MKPVSLFYSYSHRDEALRLELEGHLGVLRRGGLISEWHDRMIGAGDDWKGEIDRALVTADIVLLLVSADFIASDYCWGEEMTKALERHERGEARVIPVILRHCRWLSTPLARLQAVPRDALPVMAWADRDEAFDDVVAAIERTVAAMRGEAEPERLAEPEPKPTPVEKSTGPADFEVFRDVDASWCPELVALPAGTFLMGAPEDQEGGRCDDEGPEHRVRIGSRFALGRYPVTFQEYDHFCEETAREKPEDEGWGRGRRPVIYVSWEDAQAYVKWLAKETGQGYRLPSEAEWEYACRAGTTTPFSFGATITTDQANYDGNYTYGKGREGVFREQTTEVGSFAANPWGLHDMHGNVWEWVEDRWHESYRRAPQDGSAWVSGKSSDRVLRGGSWIFDPRDLRSAKRHGLDPGGVLGLRGFRVARTL